MNERYPVLSMARYLLYALAALVLVAGLCGGIAAVGDAGAGGFLGALFAGILAAVMLVVYAELVGLALALERNTRQAGEAGDQMVNLLRGLNASQQEMLTLQKQIYSQPGQGGQELKTAPRPTELPSEPASSSPPRTPEVPATDATTRTSTPTVATAPPPAGTPTNNLPTTFDLHAILPTLSAEESFRLAQDAIRLGRYTAAAELLTRAVTLEPPYVEAYPLRAEVFRHLNEPRRAEADMETYRRLTEGG